LRRLRRRSVAPVPGLPRLLRAARRLDQPLGVLGGRRRALLQRRRVHRRDRAGQHRGHRPRPDGSRALDRHDAPPGAGLHPPAPDLPAGPAAAHQRADHAREGLVAPVGDLGVRAHAGGPGDHLRPLRAVRDLRAHRALLLRAHLGAGLALARPRAAPARRLTRRGAVAPTLLKVEGLTKRFGDRVAVAGCSLTIAEGEIVVIIGPSGCGKTTFLRCINRLEAPTAGSVVLRDEPIGGQMRDGRWRPFTESELASQRRRSGFGFQRFNRSNPLPAPDTPATGPRRRPGSPPGGRPRDRHGRRRVHRGGATRAILLHAARGADAALSLAASAMSATGYDLVLREVTALTVDPARPLIEDAVIAIRDHRLAVVTSASEVPRDVTAARTLTLPGRVVTPGFVNVHTHAILTMCRGMAEDMGFAPAYTPGVPKGSDVRPDEARALARLGALEALLFGSTLINDTYVHADVTVSAMAEIGGRVVTCGRIHDVDFTKVADGRWEHDAKIGDETLGAALALAERWQGEADGRIGAQLSPHAPDTCSDSLLRRV